MWLRYALMKACFVHTAAVCDEFILEDRMEESAEERSHSGGWVWAGPGCVTDCMVGESWELVTGLLCEIYSNFFNYWRANGPAALIVGGQILGRAALASTQRARRRTSQKQLLLCDVGETQHSFLWKILGLWVLGTSWYMLEKLNHHSKMACASL